MFNLFKKSAQEIEIFSPLDGEIFPLSASPDEAFGTGLMGDGICINPTGDTLYAPFDCSVDIFHTLHAVGCKQSDIELVVHIGMNTVSLKGEGFKALSALQATLEKGTPLVSFDADLIKSKVETLITPVIIVSKPDTATLTIIKESGPIKAGELIMRIKL